MPRQCNDARAAMLIATRALHREAERGLAWREIRSQLLPFLSRSLKVHGASNEMPMMSFDVPHKRSLLRFGDCLHTGGQRPPLEFE